MGIPAASETLVDILRTSCQRLLQLSCSVQKLMFQSIIVLVVVVYGIPYQKCSWYRLFALLTVVPI
jgi:hypothetical protein